MVIYEDCDKIKELINKGKISIFGVKHYEKQGWQFVVKAGVVTEAIKPDMRYAAEAV